MLKQVQKAVAWGYYTCTRCEAMLTVLPEHAGRSLNELVCPACFTPLDVRKPLAALPLEAA